ncbi:hypothetical protein B7494_g457 [Chlorociboria aeruginascens]|nr:hypothetical protein B7494_g457 [Chlorociboria aeruginascens]
MSQKRKLLDTDTQDVVHASRQSQVYGTNPRPSKKPRRSEPVELRKQAHASSVNAIKKRIRDVSRRLERADGLPANVRVEDERALAAYQQDLAAADAEKTRQKMIKRYHMVRFFERQKATRQLKKLRKRILETTFSEEVEELKTQMHIAEVDLNYTQFSPLSEPYVSLYPLKNTADGDEESKEKETKSKPPMWAEVEKCMEDNTLDQLRNRRTTMAITVSKPPKKKASQSTPAPKPNIKLPAPLDTTGVNRRQRRSQQRGIKSWDGGKTKNKSIGFAKNQAFGASESVRGKADDGAESDGGFFEE